MRKVKIFRVSLVFALVSASCSAEDELQQSVASTVARKATMSVERPDTLRVLLIGNSYAGSAVDYYLSGMLKSASVEFVIGRLHRASCSLAMHCQYAASGEAAYQLRIMGSDGTDYTDQSVSLPQALAWEQWNMVSMQEVSSCSGLYEYYQASLSTLMEYVRQELGYEPIWIWHQTWAYDADYAASAFAAYDYDQSQMWEGILDAVERVMEDYPIDLLVPCGTAVQNARLSGLDGLLTSDGTHLSDGEGRLTAASAWYEALTGQDVRELGYSTSAVSEENASVAFACAHYAVSHPYEAVNVLLIEEPDDPLPVEPEGDTVRLVRYATIVDTNRNDTLNSYPHYRIGTDNRRQQPRRGI